MSKRQGRIYAWIIDTSVMDPKDIVADAKIELFVADGKDARHGVFWSQVILCE